MDFIPDFLRPLTGMLSWLYGVLLGNFLPSSCTYCRPLYWVGEVAVVGFILFYLNPQGPREG